MWGHREEPLQYIYTYTYIMHTQTQHKHIRPLRLPYRLLTALLLLFTAALLLLYFFLDYCILKTCDSHRQPKT